MRKIDFDNKTSWEILDMKNLVQRLITENYAIDRIKNLLGITNFQMKMIMSYQYSQELENFIEKQNDVTEEEMIMGASAYSYEDLAPVEKQIYNSLGK